MKLVVSGGGTGGHVYPALTVINVLREPKPAGMALPTLAPADVLWIGSRGGIEEGLVERTGTRFLGLAAGGLRGVGLLAKIRNAFRIGGSLGRARSIRIQTRCRPGHRRLCLRGSDPGCLAAVDPGGHLFARHCAWPGDPVPESLCSQGHSDQRGILSFFPAGQGGGDRLSGAF